MFDVLVGIPDLLDVKLRDKDHSESVSFFCHQQQFADVSC